jgi:valyl-tRNA synthetase
MALEFPSGRYDVVSVEQRTVARWLESGIFHPVLGGESLQRFSVALPQPNVTGALHMGHALNASIQDVLVRHKRAQGMCTKWTFGTDHAGIATQNVVERQLISEGTSRQELGREAFEARVWEWRKHYGKRIVEQFQRLGASCDYEEEHFTLDESYVRAVQKAFVDLYEKGWIYRDRYLVNWDPGSGSAISDLEVESREVLDTLHYISYALVGGTGAITVATVRPVTILADAAIAVNPQDERYTHLVGQSALVPLMDREIPIISDEHVKPNLGTGALKITPAHDPHDFEIGRRHGLAQIGVIGQDGRMTAVAGERYMGLTVADAEAAVLADLRAAGCIEHSEEHRHAVPFSQRSGARIEPLISLQWFVRMDELAMPAIETVVSGRTRILPARWKRIYLDWMARIPPWCISRQLWWGHQLPVWYRGEETYVATNPPEGDGWERDPDVLDTWFSGVLWPYASLGWPKQTPVFEAFYPTDVLVTAHDIIFLWVARMVMLGIEFTGVVPFSDVHIHSVLHAADGQRMSKSLGTGIDPLGEIARYGADAVRFGLLAMATSQNVPYTTKKIEQGQRLVGKLWNASRLILASVEDVPRSQCRPQAIEDRWVVSRLSAARTEIEHRIESYDFARAALDLYDFVYSVLCDWYLEFVKLRLQESSDDERRDRSSVLVHLLSEVLALAHPVLPFVTEEIWGYVPGSQGMLAGRQATEAADRDPPAERSLEAAIAAIRVLRSRRKKIGVPGSTVLAARLDASGYEETATLVAQMARISLVPEHANAQLLTLAIPGGRVVLAVPDVVDMCVIDRLLIKRVDQLARKIERTKKLLATDQFLSKAPNAVVRNERKRLSRLLEERAIIEQAK